MMIHRTLKGEVHTRDALKSRDQVHKREKAFRVETHISFDNEGSEIYTIIEVDTRDRPGLLFDLARTLAASNVYIANAVIATYGEQVVDTFYVKDMFGLKYHSTSKQATLEKRLRGAIAEGAKNPTIIIRRATSPALVCTAGWPRTESTSRYTIASGTAVHKERMLL